VGAHAQGEKTVKVCHSSDVSPKVRATLYLPADLLDEARDATVFLAGYPARLTLTKLVEHAFRAELRRLKQLYNDGQDFPQRSEDLKGGRPIAA
jgi:hypothetical protein